MSEDPAIDGRRRGELREHVESIAPYYTDAWDPESDDVGTVVLELFAELTEDVIERLDRVPEKHRVGFFDALGFRRHPPQSAKLPLTFAVSADLDENVGIPARTRAIADPTDDGDEHFFQVLPGGGFEATPATLDRVYSLDPIGDMVFDNRSATTDSEDTVLFGGRDDQRHVLYVGHEDGLTVNPGTTIGVSLETNAPVRVLRDHLVWEFYGERERERDGAVIEEWHPFDGRLIGDRSGGTIRLDLELPDTGRLVETAIDEVTTRWIRCRVPTGVPPTEPYDVRIGRVAVGPVPDVTGSNPDAMRYNDVPLPIDIDGEGMLPFGRTPQRLDTFYVASAEAFSKKGVTVGIDFETDQSISTTETEPRLSWEYWNGAAWVRIPELEDGTDRLRNAGVVSFAVPEDLEPTGVAGEQGHWIRVRLVGGHYGKRRFEPDDEDDEGSAGVTWSQADTVTPPEFTGVTVAFDAETPPLVRSEHLVAYNNLAYSENLVPLQGERFRPFIGLPDETQTVYLGFDGPLRNGPINLLFALADVEYPAAFYPRIRWEYCRDPARDAWARLDVDDGTESLTQRGIVGLVFPETTTAFERFGRRRHWIRARLTGDEFDPEPAPTPAGPGPIVISEVYPVRELVVITNRSDDPFDLSDYRIDFEYNQPAVQVRQFPDGTTLAAGESLVLATGSKSIGPADLQFDYRRHVINRADADVIAILTPAGELLTKQTYRERAEKSPIRRGSILEERVRQSETQRESERRSNEIPREPNGPPDETVGTSREPYPPACFETLSTVPPTGVPGRTPPTVRGIYPNAGWAINVRPVEDEILGSSDGSQTQQFVVSSPPIVEGEIWVDELTARSEGERQRLEQDPDVETETVTGGKNAVEAFWVRWRRVADFLSSGPDDRHYTLDPATGSITFGNGNRGEIPPHGRDNVRASYRTGGGAGGNVDRRTVTDLGSSIPFVDDVTNPIPGDGGADAESTDQVLMRAPEELRNRNRAVTETDFERIAAAASRKLAKIRCIPGMDEHGDRTPGWVTLLLVPREGGRQPAPSTEIKKRVRNAMVERAPATLFDPDQLVVRGPSYVEVSADVALIAEGGVRISVLEARTVDALDSFLHPLTGGPDGDGWEFGTVPCLSDLYALLEGIEGVDHVDDLAVTVAGSEAEVTLTEGQPTPSVAPDTLVFSGVHEIGARGGR